MYHVLLMVVAMYYAMIYSNWGYLPTANEIIDYNPSNSVNRPFWLQISALWTVMGIYSWAMLAPVLFPNRNF